MTNEFVLFLTGSPGMALGPRGPFQRAISMDGKPPGGPGGAGRRPMLIKQEDMMGSPDSYPGNMGVYLFSSHFLCLFVVIMVCITRVPDR